MTKLFINKPLPQPVEKMTLDQFCEWVLTQDRKYEYYQGEIFDVYAMAGAKAAHNTVSGNVFAALHNALRGKPCRPFVADMMLRVAPDGAGFYPDVMVSCSDADRARETFKTDAVLVVEVLSDSTMAYDLGKNSRVIAVLRPCKKSFFSTRRARA
jgi:Uma2 family endonuclease